jgi:hypothetical protein
VSCAEKTAQYERENGSSLPAWVQRVNPPERSTAAARRAKRPPVDERLNA